MASELPGMVTAVLRLNYLRIMGDQMINTRTRLALSFTLAAIGCFGNNAIAAGLDLREVSPGEISIAKQVAAAGATRFLVRRGTEITDTKGQKHTLVVALRGRYRLAESQPTECSDVERISHAGSGEYDYDNNGYLVKHDEGVEGPERERIFQVPAQTYIRLERKVLFFKSELFCLYDLEKASLALAVDNAAMLKSMWTREIPVVESEAGVADSSLDYTVESNGWHGAYPICKSQACSISTSKNSMPSVTLNFVR